MNKKTHLLGLIVLILLVGLCFLGYDYAKLRETKKFLEKQIAEVETKTKKIQEELKSTILSYEEVKQKNNELEISYAKLLEDNKSLNQLIKEKETVYFELSKLIDEKNQKMDLLIASLDDQKQRFISLVELLVSMKQQYDTLLVKETEKVEAAQEEINLGEIQVETAREGALQQTLQANKEGSVLSRNNQYNFVLVSLGNDDGIKQNDLFKIYDAKYNLIGEAKVRMVNDTVSTAIILWEGNKNIIKQGVAAIKE